MTIPIASTYPVVLDSDTNLYAVHDALRVTLAEDYLPGQTSISVTGDVGMMGKFPPTGIITLTEQCSDVNLRALSFFYSSKTDYSFDGLIILPEFSQKDYAKSKNITHVTLNVIAQHHNSLKDALIAIETFMGVSGKIDTVPFGDTITGRLNFLTKLVFTPKAWFRVMGSTVGLVPIDFRFKDECMRLGTGEVLFTWNFGDTNMSVASVIQTISITDPTISVISVAAGVNILNVYDFIESPETYVKKTYIKTYDDAGKYDIGLTVRNAYGVASVIFTDMVNPRLEAPREAVISIIGVIPPISTTPVIRSPINTVITLEVPSGKIPGSSPSQSYGGELLDGSNTPYDPILEYVWSLGDDLTHSQSSITKAMYSTGGLYNIKLRTNTAFGAFRITDYQNAIDIVEDVNLWLWTTSTLTSKQANEFGLISETFKIRPGTIAVTQNSSFLTGSNNETQAKREFNRNVAVTPKATTSSGQSGSMRMYWAEGGNNPTSSQTIGIAEYVGFTDAYTSPVPPPAKYWNWLCLNSSSVSYFLFGSMPTGSIPAGHNPSDQNFGVLPKSSAVYTTDSDQTYINGADDLMEHISDYGLGTVPLNGYFAVYRGCWKGGSGYFIRNGAVDPYFQLNNFYKTNSVIGDELVSITKMPDMAGSAKVEGQLVPLYNGVFFFNNSGSISAYNDTTGVWETGGPSLSSVAYRSVQDTSIVGFDSAANTLLAASDGGYVAYLSFDYSINAFIKFNGQNLTFSSMVSRPTGDQFVMGIY